MAWQCSRIFLEISKNTSSFEMLSSVKALVDSLRSTIAFFLNFSGAGGSVDNSQDSAEV